MSSDIKSDSQDCCTLCLETLCSLKVLTVNEDILVLLKFIVEIDHIVLQDSLICESCQENIHKAYEFKNLCIENLQKSNTNVNIKHENDSNEKFVVCSFCRNSIKLQSSKPLLELSYGQDIVNNLIPISDLKKNCNPLLCERCQVCLSDMESLIILFLSCIERKINHDQLSTINKVKEEIKIEEEENSGNISEFRIKNKELDLKMEDDAESSGSGLWKSNQPDSKKNMAFLNENDLNKQILTNEDTLFKCKICHYKSNFIGRLNRHMFTHVMNVSKIYTCTACNYQVHQYHNIDLHMKIHEESYEIFKCDFCEYETSHKIWFHRHMRNHRNVNGMFQCEICEFQTRIRLDLDNHEDKHKIYCCDLCEYRTHSSTHLEQHMLMHKDPDQKKLFKCDYCNYINIHKPTLTRHMVNHNQNQDVEETEIFQCFNCKFETKDKYRLKQHMHYHLVSIDIEAYKCQICKYWTKYKKRFKRHMISHENLEKSN